MNHLQDRHEATRWAYEMSRRKSWAVLDTETTGLGDTDQICQIAITDSEGNALLNTLVKPTIAIPPNAQRIHGITDEMVRYAPSFDIVFPQVLKAIAANDLVIYNASYDVRMIQQSLRAHGIYLEVVGDRWINGAQIACAMRWYSQFVGDWNSYRKNYKWQQLPSGDHSALGDCKATVGVIRGMAAEFKVGTIA